MRSIVLACVLTVLPPASSAVEVAITDLSVSGGMIYENLVAIPVGETVTIGTRISNPGSETWHGIGLSYYGYDAALLGFESGDATTALLQFCIPPSFCVPGLSNHVGGMLFETATFPAVPLAGQPRVRVALGLSDYQPTSQDGSLDPGLDGVVGGGDSQFRVTFDGLAVGQTEVVIGTGDDRGGILLQAGGTIIDADNALVRVYVPEPGLLSGLIVGLSAIAISRARSVQQDDRLTGHSCRTVMEELTARS